MTSFLHVSLEALAKKRLPSGVARRGYLRVPLAVAWKGYLGRV